MKKDTKRQVRRRVHTMISKLDELQAIERECPEDLRLPGLENMKQQLFNWYCDNSK